MAKTQTTSGNGQVTRVAFYTRISTDEDHQKYSLGAQSERLEAFCKAQYGDDWKLHKLYRDTESGTHMNRPGLEEMIATCSTLLALAAEEHSDDIEERVDFIDTVAEISTELVTEDDGTPDLFGDDDR